MLRDAFYVLKPAIVESAAHFMIYVNDMKQDLKIDDEAAL